MPAAPSLREWQRAFLAALYNPDDEGPIDRILGNGLTPAARLRIYRHSCAEIHVAALATSYPALLALGGQDWFEQTARGYLRAYPSASGNLQRFGADLASYLETLATYRAYPYFADVARLEWLRQETILAAPARALASEVVIHAVQACDANLQMTLHPSVHLLASDYPVLTIWHFALEPTSEGLDLTGPGESVMTWREDGEVACAPLVPSTYFCVAALREGATLSAAHAAAISVDANFDMASCLDSLVEQGLIVGVHPVVATGRDSTCP